MFFQLKGLDGEVDISSRSWL